MSIIPGLSGLLGEGNSGKEIWLPSPEGSIMGVFDDTSSDVEQEVKQCTRPALNIGGMAAHDIINLAMKNRAPGVLRVMHVMPNAVKPISISITKDKTCSDVWLELYAAMSDGTSTAASKFNIKVATLKKNGIDGRIMIAASTKDKDIFSDCILGLGLQKVEETTIHCHESFVAMEKLCSWQREAVTNDEFIDLTKAMHLILEMQTFKDDAGSFDGILGDAIISLHERPSSKPAMYSLIHERIESFKRP